MVVCWGGVFIGGVLGGVLVGGVLGGGRVDEVTVGLELVGGLILVAEGPHNIPSVILFF